MVQELKGVEKETEEKSASQQKKEVLSEEADSEQPIDTKKSGILKWLLIALGILVVGVLIYVWLY